MAVTRLSILQYYERLLGWKEFMFIIIKIVSEHNYCITWIWNNWCAVYLHDETVIKNKFCLHIYSLILTRQVLFRYPYFQWLMRLTHVMWLLIDPRWLNLHQIDIIHFSIRYGSCCGIINSPFKITTACNLRNIWFRTISLHFPN